MAVFAWVVVASDEGWTGIVPAAVGAAFLVGDYVLWLRRGEPWHDPLVIVAALPSLAAGLWIAVGGLVTDVPRGEAGRLALEVGPGLAVTGLVCTLVSYFGRHRP